MDRYPPYLHSNLTIQLHNCRAFLMLLRTAGQSSSNRSSGRPKYLNTSTISTLFAPSYTVRLNFSSVYLFAIATSRLRHCI